MGFAYNLHTLNPIYNTGFNGGAMIALAFSYLLRPLPDGRLEPDAAREVPTVQNGGIARDGRTITYHLRPGMKWQDGQPLTSADVAFTFREIMNPKNTIGSRFPYDRVARVDTPDPLTVRVHFRAPDAAMPAVFLTSDSNAAIIPAHLLSQYASLDQIPYNAMPVGSGPYTIVGWERGATLRLVANPLYYGGTPNVAAIELRYSPDENTTLVRMQSGELDGALNVDITLTARYRALAGKRVTNIPYTGATVVTYNNQRSLLGDIAMRRALSMAIDRETLIRNVFHGEVPAADPARGLFSYAYDPSAPWPRYNLPAAERTLDALGWRRSLGGIRARNGRELTFTLIYSNSSDTTRTAAVLVQQQLARAGVRIELKSYLYTQYYQEATDGGPVATGRFDLALVAYSTNLDPDQKWLFGCDERAPHGYNWARYCNSKADALIAAATRELPPAQRIATLHRLQQLTAAEAPFTSLWQTREVDVLPASLHGFVPNGTWPYGSVRNWNWKTL